MDWNDPTCLHHLDGLPPVVIAELGALLAQRPNAEECDICAVPLQAVGPKSCACMNQHIASSSSRARVRDQERVTLRHPIFLGASRGSKWGFDEALELGVRGVLRQNQPDLEPTERHGFLEVGNLHLILA